MTRVKICGITSKTEVDFINRYLPDYIGFVFAASKRRVTPEKAAELAAGLSPAIKKVGVFVDMEPEEAAGTAAIAGLDALQLCGSEDARYIAGLRRLLKPGTEIWKAVRMGGGVDPGSGCETGGGIIAGYHSEPGGGTHPGSGSGPGGGSDKAAGGEDTMSGHPQPVGAFVIGSMGDSPEYTYECLEAYSADRLILDTYNANRAGGTGQTFDWGLAQRLGRRVRLPIILAGGLNPGNVRQAIEQVAPFAVDTSSGVEGVGIKDEEKVRSFIEAVRGESR